MQFLSLMEDFCSSTQFVSKLPQGKDVTDQDSAFPFPKHLCMRRRWDIPLIKVPVSQQCDKNSCNSWNMPHVVCSASGGWVEGSSSFHHASTLPLLYLLPHCCLIAPVSARLRSARASQP